MDLCELVEQLAMTYALGRPAKCELLRSYTNDVYAVQSPAGRFVLKVYGSGWRTAAEIRYEVALIEHLCRRGLATAAPIAGTDGDRLQALATPDGPRHAVLFVHAPGEKPQPPFTPDLYRAFGRAVAQMHTLSDDFVTEHPRRSLDLGLLIDEPLSLAVPLIEAREDREFLIDIAERVKSRIVDLAAAGLDWGPIHGDATLDNLHVTASGEVVLYDYDSGGPGWRAADLQGWAAHCAEHRAKWAAFQQGYSEERPVEPADLQAAPWLTVAWDIWGLQIDLENRILRQDRARGGAFLRTQVAAIRERVVAMGFSR